MTKDGCPDHLVDLTDEEWLDMRPVWPLDVAWLWAMVCQAALCPLVAQAQAREAVVEKLAEYVAERDPDHPYLKHLHAHDAAREE